jgi:hypothetical protein
MLKNLLLATTAASALALGAPVAHADAVRTQCSFDAINAPAVQPDDPGTYTYTGVLYGFAVFDDQGSHTLRCYITVDGAEVASTATGAGTTFVGVAAPLQYTESDGSDVKTCTEIDGVASCEGPTTIYLPPGEYPQLGEIVLGLLDDLVIGDVDPTVCPILASLSPGIPGVVEITPEGDTTIDGFGPFWDCPPYGNLFPPS